MIASVSLLPVSALLRSIRVVVEDKESAGGAFGMKVSPTATVERLQQEVTRQLKKKNSSLS